MTGSTDPADAIQTPDQAWAVVVREADILPDSSPLLNGISQQAAVRMALKAAHPDRGGSADRLRQVVRAKEILDAASQVA